MKSTTRRRIGAFLLTLFIGYITCLILFMHIHFVDGVAVVHAHPMCHNQTHSHAPSDYFALGEYTGFNALSSLIEFKLLPPNTISYEEIDTTPTSIEIIYLANHALRDPPYVCSLYIQTH